MKKLLAVAGALALAACGGADDAAVDTGDQTAEAAPASTSIAGSPLVGTYGGSDDQGGSWTSTINADGTYEDTVGGEVTDTGRWTHEGDQICFDKDVMEGESPDQTCLTLVNINDDGSLLMRDSDGAEMNVPRLP